VLCRVPRYSTNTCNWSVPAGGVEKGEEPLVAARREAWEETGYETSDHRLVYSYFPQQGSSNKQFLIVFCKAGDHTGQPDPDEISEVRWFTLTVSVSPPCCSGCEKAEALSVIKNFWSVRAVLQLSFKG